MKKVLWLTSWYPNRDDPFSGDFIKRQAEAVSLFQPVQILFVGKYSPRPLQEQVKQVNSFPNLKEYLLYYPASDHDNLFTKGRSVTSYFLKHLQIIRQLHKKNELPDLVHVQVAWKSGLIALYLKWKYKIPYVLTEHWSGYYPQAKDSLFRKSYLERYWTRRIIGKANQLITVSEALGKQIRQSWLKVPFQQIPNVVNTRFFFTEKNKRAEKFRFIHISTLKYPKNPEGILRVFAALRKTPIDAELVLVGPVNTGLDKMIREMGLPEQDIRCTGEIPYKNVGIELRHSSVLILFSHYENMPCVLLESLCSGIPVIASRVGGIPEVVDETNGILVKAGDENDLLEAMKTMIRKESSYDREKISSRAAAQFSYEVVGKEILSVYESVLGNR